MGLFSRKKDKAKDEKKTGAKSAVAAAAEKVKSASVKTEPKAASMRELYGGGKTTVKTEDKKTASQAEAAGKKITGQAYRLLVKPLVTEKAANLGAENKYVFAVAPGANKIEIAKAITEVYGIKPLSVNIIRVSGKKIRYGRIRGERKDWKKAIIMLPAGKTINIYEGV